jgi:hypothetical protein
MHETAARRSEQQLSEFSADGISSKVNQWVSCLMAVAIFW